MWHATPATPGVTPMACYYQVTRGVGAWFATFYVHWNVNWERNGCVQHLEVYVNSKTNKQNIPMLVVRSYTGRSSAQRVPAGQVRELREDM